MIPCWWRGCVGQPRGIPNGASAHDGFKLKVRGVLAGQMQMKAGDLVRSCDPFEEGFGLVIEILPVGEKIRWLDGSYRTGNVKVLWDGRVHYAERNGIEVINESR
jgi:hypothetical protein